MRSFILAISLIAAAIVSAGTWQPLTHPYPAPLILNPNNGNLLSVGAASFPILMTDGSVMVQNCSPFFADGRIFKLTPDSHGSYVDGTWSELAPMPYVQAAAAQAVLADGRVIIEGGEYSGVFLNFLLTNQGAIYNPVTNTWTSVPPPSFFVDLYPPRAVFAHQERPSSRT